MSKEHDFSVGDVVYHVWKTVWYSAHGGHGRRQRLARGTVEYVIGTMLHVRFIDGGYARWHFSYFRHFSPLMQLAEAAG